MKKAIGEFLTSLLSKNGNISSARFVLLLSLIMGFIISLIGIYKGVNLIELSALVATFVGPSTALKGFQKTVEKE